ncbi:hypothetical protein HDV00_007007 [Rhizophlyctis rosea]|nr:hypothetical protein HDV00_007007 [Rhizophlyctis rosea]
MPKSYIVLVYADYRKEVEMQLQKAFTNKDAAVVYREKLREDALKKARQEEGMEEERMVDYKPPGRGDGFFGPRVAVVPVEGGTEDEEVSENPKEEGGSSS